MNSAEKEAVLHCLKVTIDEALCEDCPLYGTTGTYLCEKDCARLAINVLEQEPCDDAISREDALMALTGEYTDSPIEILPKAIKRINALPPVNSAEKVGKWKRISMDKYSEHAKYWYRCDRCGEDNLGNTNYCPNCGAKMQEVKE